MLASRFTAAVFALALIVTSSAQIPKHPVHFVAGSGSGVIERALYYAIQERLGASSTMYEERLAKSQIVLRVSAYDLDADDAQRRGVRTAYVALLLTPKGFFISSTLGKCGAKVVNECAGDILAMTLEELRR